MQCCFVSSGWLCVEHISSTFQSSSLPDVCQFVNIKNYWSVAAQLGISSTNIVCKIMFLACNEELKNMQFSFSTATSIYNSVPNFPFY